MPRMAGFKEEALRVGSVVSCVFQKPLKGGMTSVEGEIVAWDQGNKVLVLKSESKTRPNLSNVQIINLDGLQDLQILRENPNLNPPPIPSLNVQRLQDRADEEIKKKKQWVLAARDYGATAEALKLFLAIQKTIEEVTWRNGDILVMNKVLVTKPYTADCVKASNEKFPEKKAIEHVRKIVEKHIQDRDQRKRHSGN